MLFFKKKPHECRFNKKDVLNLSIDPICKCGKTLSEWMKLDLYKQWYEKIPHKVEDEGDLFIYH